MRLSRQVPVSRLAVRPTRPASCFVEKLVQPGPGDHHQPVGEAGAVMCASASSLRVADIHPAHLPIPRPGRHTGGLPTVDPARGGEYARVLGGPVDVVGDLLENTAVTPEHPVDDLR